MSCVRSDIVCYAGEWKNVREAAYVNVLEASNSAKLSRPKLLEHPTSTPRSPFTSPKQDRQHGDQLQQMGMQSFYLHITYIVSNSACIGRP